MDAYKLKYLMLSCFVIYEARYYRLLKNNKAECDCECVSHLEPVCAEQLDTAIFAAETIDRIYGIFCEECKEVKFGAHTPKTLEAIERCLIELKSKTGYKEYIDDLAKELNHYKSIIILDQQSPLLGDCWSVDGLYPMFVAIVIHTIYRLSL